MNPNPKPRPRTVNPNYYRVTLIYNDGGTFGRVYTDLRRAEAFAAGQKKRCPFVKATRIEKE
jgi:hypothetical protein